MQVVFSETALADLVWWRRYYRDVFPDGGRKAGDAFLKVVDLLKTMPGMGRPAGVADTLEFVVPRTPFSLIYRIEKETLTILRVWDNRQESGAER